MGMINSGVYVSSIWCLGINIFWYKLELSSYENILDLAQLEIDHVMKLVSTKI